MLRASVGMVDGRMARSCCPYWGRITYVLYTAEGIFFSILPPTSSANEPQCKSECLNLLYEILLAAFPLVASYVGRLVK